MTRVTAKSLRYRVLGLNQALERPMEEFSSVVGEPTKFSVGHIRLDHNSHGYRLEEQTSDVGGTHELTPRLTAREMAIAIDGINKGIGLRNLHLGELVLQNELIKAGLTTRQSPLYNQNREGLDYDQLMQKQAEHERNCIRTAQELEKHI